MSYAPIRSEPTLNHRAINHDSRSIFSPRTSPARSRRKRAADKSPNQEGSRPDWPIIVHCHLCWDWVWQRPQQFISRLSERHKVLFIETIGPDPELAAPLARFRQLPEFPNITVLRLQFPKWRWDDGDYIDLERRHLVQEFLAGPFGRGFENPIQWFYDPMAVPSFS